jgi:hypothetical protein
MNVSHIGQLKWAIDFANSSAEADQWILWREGLCKFLGIQLSGRRTIDTTVSARQAKEALFREYHGKSLLDKRKFPRPVKGTVTQYDQDGFGAVLVRPFPWEFTEKDICILRDELKTVLLNDDLYLLGTTEISKTSLTILPPLGAKEEPAIFVSGSARDIFFLKLSFLLAGGGNSVARCKKCPKIFWRTTIRKNLCSDRCINLNSTHKHRDPERIHREGLRPPLS